jgi:hypothetical protein
MERRDHGVLHVYNFFLEREQSLASASIDAHGYILFN